MGKQKATKNEARRKKAAPVGVKHVVPPVQFEGGAMRSALELRYDLLPKAAIAALGRRLTLGAKHYGENNWRGGGEQFRKDTISRLIAHLNDYIKNGNAGEANTDAIICNAAFLWHFEEREPYKPRAVKVVEAAPKHR